MTRHWLRGAALFATLVLAGCGQSTSDTPQDDTQTRLGDSVENIDLAGWLKLSRPDLVKLADEWAGTIKTQHEEIRSNSELDELLPRFLPPLEAPGFRDAKFVPALGFSVPDYVDPARKDAAVAFHLARFGDHEAAVKLADPADAGLRKRLEAVRAEKNYPIEWTRLVGLVLASGHLKLSTGDVDGATLLAVVHTQLRELLDSKAAAGTLGATLLPVGKRALEQAAKAWRDPRRTKTTLADDIDKAVAEWGATPLVKPAVDFGASTAEVTQLLGVGVRGKAVMADKPPSVARAVDLLGLSFGGSGVEVVSAFLDADGKLARWLVGYEAKIDTLYPEPSQLVYSLLEAGGAAEAEKKSASLVQQTFTAGGVRWDVVRTSRSPALGALVSVAPAKNALTPARVRSLRDFGPVHLDRGFEACRLALSPRQFDTALTVREAAALKKVGASLETPDPSAVVLHRDRTADVVTAMEMSWKPDENRKALSKLLPAVWDDYGPGVAEAVEDAAGSYLAFTWKDEQTLVQLRLAFDDRGPVLVVRDNQAPDKLPARVALAQQLDEQARQARLAANKPEVRLSRAPAEVNDLSLEELKLGQPRAQALAALPRSKSYRRVNVPGGVSVVVMNTPPSTATSWLRQILLRFDRNDRLAEIRLRYTFGPARAKKGESLLDGLSDAKSGAGEVVPPRWAGLWSDLPRAGKTASYRWRDDHTVRIYSEDVEGAEVVLLDRPASAPVLEPKPWRFVSRGVKGANVGDTRQAVRAALKLPAARMGEADVYRLPANSPYEMVLVWYDGDKVSKVVAVHRDRPGKEAKDVTAAMSKAWGRDVDSLGFIRRREGESRSVLGSYFWNDDTIRVQTSVQTGDNGQRLTTEWRAWPGEAKLDPTKARAAR